jgi:hypothetical protein
MNELVQAVKATGSIGVVGVFVPKDPKSKRNYKKKATWILTLVNSG